MSMSAPQGAFGPCEICGSVDWQSAYTGPVRDGMAGRISKYNAKVAECGECSVQRLEEHFCISASHYDTESYRVHLGQSSNIQEALREQDWGVRFIHDLIWPESLRGQTVMDVGCGAGSFLDTCKGIADQLIVIEPCATYHDSLLSRGYHIFSATEAAVKAYHQKVNIGVSIQVIEHVRNPVSWLKEIGPLLAPGGKLIITTPNRDDILMKLIPETFKEFFYRSAHRWYFDMESLIICAEKAGYEVVEQVIVAPGFKTMV